MVNMQMSAEEAKEYASCSPSTDNAPKYPYGLCLDLCDDSLEKLGITDLPAVGTEMTLVAKVIVTRTGAYQTQGGEGESSMGLQITDMELARPSTPRDVASNLYGKTTG